MIKQNGNYEICLNVKLIYKIEHYNVCVNRRA